MTTQTQVREPAAPGARNRPASDPKSKVFSVRIPLEEASKIEDLATARGVTPSRLLALMLDDYFNQRARVQLQETLLQVENRSARRDVQIEAVLKRLETKVAGIETLLQESLPVE